mmetsp:Transcript_9880/g.29354  ORF Transcript_9880/g.29354 Transcript_9880/m.29354 type:complete len:82 (+) Transcript_9880:1861-2106(+)
MDFQLGSIAQQKKPEPEADEPKGSEYIMADAPKADFQSSPPTPPQTKKISIDRMMLNIVPSSPMDIPPAVTNAAPTLLLVS